MKPRFILFVFWRLLGHGVSGTGGESVSVMEGNSVTLNSDVKTNQQEKIRWYFNNTRIAEIIGDLSKICTDVQCNEGSERFRGRLELDHQTGSLTITNTRTTDSGDYKLKISGRNNSDSDRSFSVTFHGVSGVGLDGVSVFVLEEDSLTLNTDGKINQQDIIRWYFNGIRIAQMNGDRSRTCTDVQCKDGDERFTGRLKLDQTGSLTITNTTTTDAGNYNLRISRDNSENDKSFNFAVHNVSAAERDRMKRKSVKEGESVTLDPCEVKNQNELMTWHFNDIPISQERFRDRLKVNNQTGSLTIMNITSTDSGLYHLQINSSRFSIIRSFSVTVTAVPNPGPLSAAPARTIAAVIGSVIVAVLLLALLVIYSRHTNSTQNGTVTQNGHQGGISMDEATKGTSSDQVRESLLDPNNESPKHDNASSAANGKSQ